MAIELTQCDSIKAELKDTQGLLESHKSKMRVQDSVIVFYEKKEIEYKAEAKIFGEKETVYNNNINDLKKKNSDLELKNKRLKTASQWLGGGLIATLVTLITVISIK